MPSQNDSGTRPRIAAAVPNAHMQALDHIVDERSAPGDRTARAELNREAIELYLAIHKATGELPPEALSNVEAIDASEVLEQYGLTIRGGEVVTTDDEEVRA